MVIYRDNNHKSEKAYLRSLNRLLDEAGTGIATKDLMELQRAMIDIRTAADEMCWCINQYEKTINI